MEADVREAVNRVAIARDRVARWAFMKRPSRPSTSPQPVAELLCEQQLKRAIGGGSNVIIKPVKTKGGLD